MTVHLTVPGVLAAMTAAVEARGRDYVYQPPEDSGGDCLYVHDGCASCMVGDTLARCGVPVDVMAAYEGQSACSLIKTLEERRLVTYEAGVILALGVAQRVQDQDGGSPGSLGRTWGEALDAAVDAAREVAS